MTRSAVVTKDYLLDRLSNTDDPNACWEWQRYRRNGYGRFARSGKWFTAHRAVFELFVGPIPEGHDVCHHCDNPACCNPAHLFSGTVSDNMRDRNAKGRNTLIGSRHGRAKMTEAMVLEIRRLWAEGKHTQRQIAEMFGVHRQRVNSAVKRRTWTHV